MIKVLNRDKYLILLVLPAIIFYAVFQYGPMYGLLIAFKNYSAGLGILNSPWVGFKWFENFFNSIFFFRILRNTLLISIYYLLWSFPINVIFALLLNEVVNPRFKKIVQTSSYLPHFISVIVASSMVIQFTSLGDGIINRFIEFFGGESVNFLNEAKWFRTVYIVSGIWQHFGWNSIIFLAAITGIDQQLYEAATIDGAGRFRKIVSVTLPCIIPTVIILFILEVGNLMDVGYERIILLYNPMTYETSDVISTYIYRYGIAQSQYSLGAAVGLFNSVINFIILITFNTFSRRVSEISLW